MFIRILSTDRQKEVLVNVNSIWKIEVSYAVPGQNKVAHVVGLEEGRKNTSAFRVYKVFYGSETANLVASPDDPVLEVLEEIYKNAVKAPKV